MSAKININEKFFIEVMWMFISKTVEYVLSQICKIRLIYLLT